MRIVLMSFVVLMGLMISVAAIADSHEMDAGEGTEAAEELPPVQASSSDTTIAAPATPETGEDNAAEDESQED